MNKNKKLWISIVLTTAITFPAGWALGNGAINKGLVNALGSVGENLFGEGNFGTSVVDVDGTGTQAVQIDVAVPPQPIVPPDPIQPPEPVIPVLLNVFQPPTPVAPACVASAQIVVTAEGVEVIINDDPLAVPPTPILVSYGPPQGQPPEPCRNGDTGIDPNPG
jgi:hypothetical protein